MKSPLVVMNRALKTSGALAFSSAGWSNARLYTGEVAEAVVAEVFGVVVCDAPRD
jgi:hypothetical protein